MANNDTQAVYKAYINNKKRELVRLGFGEVLDIEDEEQVLRVLKGVSDVSELVGIATTNNPAESILKTKHLTYNEVLVGRAQDDYNSDYDARVAEINKLRIQQSSQKIAKGVSKEPEVPQLTDELELKKNDMLENMFSNNVLFNNLGSNNQLEDVDGDDLVEEDEYDYSNEADSNMDSKLSIFDEEDEELEDEEPKYSEETNLAIFDEPEDEDEDEEVDYSAEEDSTDLSMFDDEDDDEDEEVDYSDEDEDLTNLSFFDDEDEDEDEEVDYSAEDEDEDASENLSFFDEDEEDEDEEIDYSAEDEEFEDDNLDLFDDDEDSDEDEEYDYSEGDSDSEEDLSMFDEDEDEDDEDEYSDEEDEDDDSDADLSIFDDEDDDDVIEVKTEPKPSTTSNVTPITSTPQRNVQPKSKPVQRRKLDASDRAFLGIVNNGLNIVAKTQKYIKGERK